ncbi:hypothetical protein C8F04DRAFT_214954 [Mycena alexandri]|uniref:Secreted protein n=1 Tax=Mycena alexandri TaxID=1745969 RepID=A0AAD6TKE2_9AGAR|nr:hypothetical protein C8F04DRAFT_214954 [Mycena alexandri]
MGVLALTSDLFAFVTVALVSEPVSVPSRRDGYSEDGRERREWGRTRSGAFPGDVGGEKRVKRWSCLPSRASRLSTTDVVFRTTRSSRDS